MMINSLTPLPTLRYSVCALPEPGASVTAQRNRT